MIKACRRGDSLCQICRNFPPLMKIGDHALILKDNIVEFLDENDIIRNTQHGFRIGRSCLTIN